MFGSTVVDIRGLRFRDGNIQVKFTAGKSEATAEGTFVDNTCIRVETPNFEMFGPQQVDVLVQISGEGWTVQKQRFSFYANTAGRNCLAYGPGLLPSAVYGIETAFRIQVCFVYLPLTSFTSGATAAVRLFQAESESCACHFDEFTLDSQHLAQLNLCICI